MLLYVKILRYCIKLYNISNLNEFIELLTLKKIKYSLNLRRRNIILYSEEKKVKVDYVKNISDDKIVLSKAIIEKPDNYLCISSELEKNIVSLIIYYVISILSVATIFINYQVSFLFIVLNIKLKKDELVSLMIMTMILLLHIFIYQNYFTIFSILFLVLSYKYKAIMLFSFLPLMLYNNRYSTMLQYTYIYYLYSYYIGFRTNSLVTENNFLKLLIKVPITVIESIVVDDEIINNHGVYFFQINSTSSIKINDINIKFIALESISEQISIFYVRNENSFFTNRQKYSKIEYVNKYYLYLLERI